MSLPQLAICTPVSDLPGQTGRVTIRLMAASPEDLRKSSGQTGWTIWEFPPAILDLKGPGSFDFPGLAVGDNSLYLNFDSFGGFIVCRIPLSEIKAGGTLHFRFTIPRTARWQSLDTYRKSRRRGLLGATQQQQRAARVLRELRS